MDSATSLLQVSDLSISFTQYTGGLRQRDIRAIDSLSLNVNPGEVLAVVGASGSGKSLLAHAILGILPGNACVAGKLVYAGQPLTPARQAALRGRQIALVPQSVNFLDPLMRVGAQVRSGALNGNGATVQREVFTRYQLAAGAEHMFPFQLSGGMARRVLVATAAVSSARLVIADEPTPGLHPAIVRETLAHLKELSTAGRGVMLITHDITAALETADRIAVFYAGSTVETAPASDFCGEGELLRHPYSKALWQALPQNGFRPLSGSHPSVDDKPRGCLFAPRCPLTTPECEIVQPGLRHLRGGEVSCHHAA
jgi:peptide/nickel transport system ATP-binding protein